MSKLHAQMALLGTIDEIVQKADNPDTVKMVEAFLPGTTGVGQQGWYRELKHFLNRPELVPRDDAGTPIERDGPVTFPDYGAAIAELRSAEPASPGVESRELFASTILSIAGKLEGGHIPPPQGWDPTTEVPDPLDALIPTLGERMSGPLPPVPGIASSTNPDTGEALKETLRSLQSRADYVNFTQTVAKAAGLDPELKDVLEHPIVCTGALRKIDGKFCTLLSTSWETPYTLAQIKGVIDPHNWPDLCDFFVSVTDQADVQPDTSRGWTRILESVSGDPTQWEMRTALRYWKGVAATDYSVYINYDLDDPRVNDCGLLEVDAGFIWATPIDPTDLNSKVRIRTSKQVRIRGVSTTATAALGCGFGWGDAMSQMFTDGVTNPPAGSTAFGAPSVERPVDPPGGSTNAAPQKPGADGDSDADIEAAAKEVELLTGWRGAIIEGMRAELSDGIGRAETLGTDFAVRWSDGDGFSMEDVTDFTKKVGEQMTQFGQGMFKAAAAAIQPQADDANATGGQV